MPDILITLLFAFVGGLLPAVIWLFFWLREDSAHPEPKILILKTFFYGMLGVPVAFLIQSIFNFVILDGNHEQTVTEAGIISFLIVVVWALTEEYFKYVAARNGGLRHKANDEPLDVPIYLITAALGFSALENTLFLVTPILDGNISLTIMTGNLRFIGATLVHVASSAIIGIFGSLSYFLNNRIKKFYIFCGFFLATLLHTIFNLFIIRNNEKAYIGFIIVWLFVSVIIFLFERVKKIHLNKIQ